MPTGNAGEGSRPASAAPLFGSYGVAKYCAVGIEAGFFSLKGEVEDNLTWTHHAGVAFSTYNFPMSDAKQMPYIKAGVGLYNVKAKLDVTPGGFDESKSKFGFNVGVGYDYEMSPKYTLGLVGAYHMIQTEGESTNLISVAAKVGFGMAKK